MKKTRSQATKEKLSFFKAISADKIMRFPPGNVPRMQGIIGRRVTLRDVNRNLWTIEIRRDGNGFYFDKGWPQFYQENHLEPGDYVTFDYKHRGLFDFKLLGSNRCQKKGAGIKEDVKEEVADTDSDADADEDEDEDYVANADAVDDDDEDYVVEQWNKLSGDDEIEVLKKESKPRSSTSSSCLSQKKREKEDYFGRNIFRSGLAVRPQNPYFVSASRKLRKNMLYIPNEVIVRWKLKFESKMLVVDARGRKWASGIKKWGDGRLWCTGGWKRMCTANNISSHDTCICEFVQRGTDALYMLVHVVDAPK